ncbi:MAG: translation initiation factor IF-3, partial [Brevundimonas sp.]
MRSHDGGLLRCCDVTETTSEEHHISEPRINDRIRVAEVRLVGPNGEQVGIVRVEDALRLAQDADLDLVEVAPDARPPVCKIMDYGKYKYEADMKAREARRNQTNTVLKEIRFRLKIDPHDYGTKKGHVERFLKAGDKVKVMIMFRGREQSRPEMGVRLLQRLADDVTELGFIESMPKQDGRNMVMVLGPTKKKADQKLEQRRAAQAAAAREENAAKAAAAAQAAAEAPAEAPVAEAQAAPAPAVESPVVETPAIETPSAEPAAPVAEEAPAEVVETPAPAAPKAPAKAATPKAAAPKAA